MFNTVKTNKILVVTYIFSSSSTRIVFCHLWQILLIRMRNQWKQRVTNPLTFRFTGRELQRSTSVLKPMSSLAISALKKMSTLHLMWNPKKIPQVPVRHLRLDIIRHESQGHSVLNAFLYAFTVLIHCV